MDDIIYPNHSNESVPAQNIQIELGLSELKNFTGWVTFNAIIDIIAGALACLGIVTAAYGVPQIMAGIKLLAAVDELKGYMASNDVQRIRTAFFNLYRYFKLSGISIIVKIIFIILGIILYGVLIALFISYMPDILNNLPAQY